MMSIPRNSHSRKRKYDTATVSYYYLTEKYINKVPIRTFVLVRISCRDLVFDTSKKGF